MATTSSGSIVVDGGFIKTKSPFAGTGPKPTCLSWFTPYLFGILQVFRFQNFCVDVTLCMRWKVVTLLGLYGAYTKLFTNRLRQIPMRFVSGLNLKEILLSYHSSASYPQGSEKRPICHNTLHVSLPSVAVRRWLFGWHIWLGGRSWNGTWSRSLLLVPAVY